MTDREAVERIEALAHERQLLELQRSHALDSRAGHDRVVQINRQLGRLYAMRRRRRAAAVAWAENEHLVG